MLDWFRRGWNEAAADPDAWLQHELGVDVYGLDSIFSAAAEHDLPSPTSTNQLRELLEQHLYVEGEVLVDDLSVRASTDDDEVPLAYFFLDRRLLAAYPDRLAYATHEDWPLPAEAPGPGDAEPATTVVLSLLGDVDWDTQAAVVRLPGIRLPDLARHLRAAEVSEEWLDELTLLRAAVGPDDDLEQALRMMNRWAAWNHQYLDVAGLDGDQVEAHRIARSVMADVAGLDEVPGPLGTRRPSLGRIVVAEHLAQAVFHLHDQYGYQQLFVFDDVWAGSHRDLASSLLRWFNGTWDPLQGVPDSLT
ncbi:hypothetical protein KZZ52_44325 [Dactylosporangium sp. AC04546]|uniref:hypothetical protein n=1 Tax=Dactylosporangium sp. AC04546 TaxID=2862460 RepID=UPI002E7B8387|nr:hypothetical protein [Dactylosporangium sp. AC04546]WVK80943.1 hypothetical protein KZZ52_44325 [Dactylosporangium sp. AC04546]